MQIHHHDCGSWLGSPRSPWQTGGQKQKQEESEPAMLCAVHVVVVDTVTLLTGAVQCCVHLLMNAPTNSTAEGLLVTLLLVLEFQSM